MPINPDSTDSFARTSNDRPRRAYPARPLIGVGVVVFRGDRVLLVRRAHAPRAGEWSLPGGLQRLGETIAATARREVFEETGIDIAVGGLIDAVDLIERDPADGRIRYHYTLIDVVAEWQTGEPTAASDAAACAWFAETELDALGLWPETLRIIGLARRRTPCPTLSGGPN
jgi:ADP-ribose pyrophosphatase YjhB (NUDIX family)